MYKLTKEGQSIIRIADGASIPVADGNRDYREYLEWVAEGNTADAYVEPPLTSADYAAALQQVLDAKAQEYRYDNIHTACNWVPEFADAVALKAWAVSCWEMSNQIEADVLATTRTQPTVEEFIAEMPTFVAI
jgi:hypothetical protein